MIVPGGVDEVMWVKPGLWAAERRCRKLFFRLWLSKLNYTQPNHQLLGVGGGWEISPLCWNVDVWLLWIFEIVQHWWCLGFMDLLQWDIFYPENSINLSAAQSTQLPWNFYEGQFTEPQPGVAICAPKVIPKRAQGNPRITSRIHKYMRIQHPVDRPTVSNEILKFNLLSL